MSPSQILLTNYGFLLSSGYATSSHEAAYVAVSEAAGLEPLRSVTEYTRKFDLNIERVLEHWTIAYALREVIANALDEAALTNTTEPSIFKDENNVWHINDAGRGLRYTHPTQK